MICQQMLGVYLVIYYASFLNISNVPPLLTAFQILTLKFVRNTFRYILNPLQVGLTFFAQELKSSEIYYICPPTHLNGFVLNRIVNTPGPVYIMIVPIWYASHWWPLIHNGQYFHPAIKAV